MGNKKCIKCGVEKDMTNFSLAKQNKDGFSNKCKACVCEYVKKYSLLNKEEIKEKRKKFRIDNKTKLSSRTEFIQVDSKICSICKTEKIILEYGINKRAKDGHKSQCKSCLKIKSAEYRNKNKEKISSYQKMNKQKINIQKKIKRKTNIQYRLQCNLRTRLWGAIKNKFKRGSSISDLGCSIDEFIKYIEQHFENGMSWGNWGRTTWHLDHKKPLASFDLTNRNEFLMAVHYTNLRPIWAKDNLSKGASC